MLRKFVSAKNLLFSKRPFKLTRGGWIFILYAIGIGAGAINTGNNLIYLIFGIFLGLILASGVLSDLSLWGLTPSFQFPVSAPAGRMVALPIEILNSNKRFPSISLRIELRATHRGAPVKLQLFSAAISGGEKFTGQFLWTPPARGWFHVQEVRFITQFPFGLLLKWWTTKFSAPSTEISFDVRHGFAVSPTRQDFNAEERQSDGASQAPSAPSDRAGEGLALFGIRAFRPSDNLKRIHWKLTAKRAAAGDWDGSSYVVKQMESEQRPAALLRADFDAVQESDFEKFVSLIWSIHETLSDQGHLVNVVMKIAGRWMRLRESAEGGDQSSTGFFLSVIEPSNLESPAIQHMLVPADLRPSNEVVELDVNSFMREN